MDLTEIYQKGAAFFESKEFGFLLDYVETGFIKENDRRIIDQFTFRQQCIGAREAQTSCSVLGVELASPIIMSSMTMPIPAIADDADKINDAETYFIAFTFSSPARASAPRFPSVR